MTPATHINRWRAFALLAVAYFMTIIDLTIVNVSLPTIGRDLHFTATSLQWVVTAYALTFGGFLLLGGRAADLLGRRRVLMVGLGVFSAASLACALATAEGFLIAARAVQGLGAAVMLPAALSIVMNMFAEGAERNKALGIWGAIAASGATVGLITGGLLTRYAGWQYIFYLNVPIGMAALLLAPRMVPESRLTTTKRRFDAPGALAGTGGLVLLVDAISQAPQYGWGATRTIAVLAASAALLVAFLVIESRAKDPVLPLQIFRLRTLSGANVAGLLLGGSFFAFIFIGTLYMQEVLHYSALQTGVAWLATSLVSIALAGLSQQLVTRVGARIVMAVGMTLIGAGVLWTTQVPVGGHFAANLLGPFVVAGAGTASRSSRSRSPLWRAWRNIGPGWPGAAEHQPAARRGDRDRDCLSVAASHTDTLLHTGKALPAALTGGFRDALWALGAIALIALRRCSRSSTAASGPVPLPTPRSATRSLSSPARADTGQTARTDTHQSSTTTRDKKRTRAARVAVDRRPPSPRPPLRPSSTGRRFRLGWMPYASERRHTPGRATRSPPRGAGCRWWRSTAPRATSARAGRSSAGRLRGPQAAHRVLLHVVRRPARRRAVRGLHVLSAPGPRAVLSAFARRHLRDALPGPLRGERALPRLHGLGYAVVLSRRLARHVADRALDRQIPPGVLPARRRAGVRGLLDEWSRRRGDGQQLRADGFDGVWRQEKWEVSPVGWPQRWEVNRKIWRTNGRPTAQLARVQAGRSTISQDTTA